LFDSSQHGQLLPGTRIADRYRIVSLLGRGGMGDVYRADDLKLGHVVALKFLPRGLADDPRRLQAFHDEVRLARQVSHPDVCRVYDIGEVEGRHFLSMEYIDGEDLRGLLRRIGALPRAKGIEIARQLCAGLGAAHERGVLHRDLKPANIMLDGRGQVRITDYGLARSIGEGDRPGEVAGTPAYMAPEQLARGETSIQSDLYALGLVLYEVFTGRRVREAGSIADLLRAHEESSVTPPSSLVDDMDPAVERVILRCLEKDPRDRPRSARAVAAALPGGDPLAAALAAGETPTPGMVAAAGEAGELSPAVAGACLAGVAVGLILVSMLAQRTILVNRAPMAMPPDALEYRAREIIRRLGYVDPPAHWARGLEDAPEDREAVKRAKPPPGAIDRWDLLKTGPWPGLRFWYRQSPEPMPVYEFWDDRAQFSRNRVDSRIPRWVVPGMAGVGLDPRGGLRWFRAIPPVRRAAAGSPSHGTQRPPPGPLEPAAASGTSKVPCSNWFRKDELGFLLDAPSAAGGNPRRLSPDELREADWLRTPPDAYDHLAAWKGTWPGSAEPLLVEAATYLGRPVYFEILSPILGGATGAPGATTPAIDPALMNLALFLNIAILVGQVLLAWRNLRLGRGDRRGSLRLAQYVLLISLLTWMFRASHVVGLLEWMIFSIGLAAALLEAAWAWLSYTALEPFVRRLWPETLISWARLLNGRIRDPRVGRDLILGALLGVLAAILIKSGRYIPSWFGLPSSLEPTPPIYPMDTASLIGAVLEWQALSISSGLVALSMLLLMRIVLRSLRLAACSFVLSNTIFFGLMETEPTYSTWCCMGLAVALWVWIMVRLGLLATVVGLAVQAMLTLPITTDSSAFHFSNGLLGMGLVLALALYGAFASLGGRPLFRDA
jgi:serine/threonine-protein kinase